MEVRAAVHQFGVKLVEDCQQARVVFQARMDTIKPKQIEGVNPKAFENPEHCPVKKVEYDNVPLLDEVHELSLWGDGENNGIVVGNVSVTRLEGRTKMIDEVHIAILQFVFAGLVASHELYSWVELNMGKIVTLRLDQVQQQMDFDDGEPEEVE